MASQEGEKAPEGEEDWKKGLKAPKKDDRVQTEVRRVEHPASPPRSFLRMKLRFAVQTLALSL